MTVADSFRSIVGHPPAGVWQAPGRVNLIGEHTDYSDGFTITFAIDRQTTVAVGRRRDRQVRAWTASTPVHEPVVVDLDALTPGPGPGAGPSWARYPFGVLWALGGEGVDIGGVDLVVDSSVPMGSGLSSSAALEAAVARAIDELADTRLGFLRLATICHRAESDFVGTPTGLLDQLAVLGAAAGHGLFIDFRSLELRQLPLPLGPLVVIDTGIATPTVPTPTGAGPARRPPPPWASRTCATPTRTASVGA